MTTKFKILAVFLAALMLQSCADNQMNKQSVGTLVGGLGGAVIGSRFGGGKGALVATGLGAVAGAYLGNQIGKSLDEKDKLLMEQSSHQALEYAPTGKKVEWHNPDSGHRGYVTPVETIRHEGRICRKAKYVVNIDGRYEEATSTACRVNGEWRVQG